MTNDKFFAVKVTIGAETLDYFAKANNAIEAIDKVADDFEQRDYTWCHESITSNGLAAKTMDVGAGAYRFQAGRVTVIE